MTNNPSQTPSRVSSPAKAYNSPFEILKDGGLTQDQKLTALKNWEEDQKALLRADDENMAVQDPRKAAPSPQELIEKIQRAERYTRDERSPQ